jgi:hypothetical protein
MSLESKPPVITPSVTDQPQPKTSAPSQFLSLFITPSEEMLLPTEQMVEILSLRLEDVLPIPDTHTLVVGPGLLQRDVVVVNYEGKTFGLGIARVGKIHPGPASELALSILNLGTILKALA